MPAITQLIASLKDIHDSVLAAAMLCLAGDESNTFHRRPLQQMLTEFDFF